MEEKVNLDFTLLRKIIKQLINSDGMEVTSDYLIQQKIYYIDNVGLIEELEEILLTQIYVNLYNTGNVGREKVLNIYTPQYINYDKVLDKLEREYTNRNNSESNLNEYL